MKKIKLGTRVNPLGINRLNCADGMKCRAVLIDPDPRMKHLAFDETIKRIVEVDQNLLVKYGLRPYTAFFYLVAKLNTDLKGNVVGDDFTVEYLQLSNSLNNEFADAVEEFGPFQSLAISKVTKKGPNGHDFSHLKVKPSNLEPSQAIKDAIEGLRSNEQSIETMWNLIDRATSITAEEYERQLKEQSNDPLNAFNQPRLQSARVPQNTPYQVPQSTQNQVPQSTSYQVPQSTPNQAPQPVESAPSPFLSQPSSRSESSDFSSDLPFDEGDSFSESNDFGVSSDDEFV